ncbi:MAG: hypothetical protein K2L86_15050 [Lachnospiraceae bacterium]|nr:hypothetical protein [Lachnospiraceae bacterium]
MTKKKFKHDMQCGLGSCVAALKKMEDAEKELFRPLVLWGCSRDMAYNAQSEGCRSFYLYELIQEFSDITPFLDVIEKRLFHGMHSTGWEFAQDCTLLAYFVSDGNKRAWKILTVCYQALLKILSEKRRRGRYGILPERDNFEHMCVALVSSCFDDRERSIQVYKKIVRDLGVLIERNMLYDYDDFEWFQASSGEKLGKRTVQRLLHRTDADENTQNYARFREERLKTRESEHERKRRSDPETADEVYRRLKDGEKAGQMCSLMLGRTFMKQNKKLEVLKLAAYYRDESDPDVRYNLLRLIANKTCAWAPALSCLIADTQSEHSELSEWTFTALGYRKDAKVRDYAIALLRKGEHTADAVSMLAANYEAADRELFVDAVRRIPITYEDGYWHSAFHDVMDLFSASGKDKPKELLLYMYQNTLCSYCREHVVMEMGRRRMLTRELLEEMQYDSNDDIRNYAGRKLQKENS